MTRLRLEFFSACRTTLNSTGYSVAESMSGAQAQPSFSFNLASKDENKKQMVTDLNTG